MSGERTTSIAEAPCGEQSRGFMPGTQTCSYRFAPAPHSSGLSFARGRGGGTLAILAPLETIGGCTGTNDEISNYGPPDPMDTPGAEFRLSGGQLAKRSTTRAVDLAEALETGIIGAANFPLSSSCSGVTCTTDDCRTRAKGKVPTTCSYSVGWSGRVAALRLPEDHGSGRVVQCGSASRIDRELASTYQFWPPRRLVLYWPPGPPVDNRILPALMNSAPIRRV